MPTISKDEFDSKMDKALHQNKVRFWVVTAIIVVTCGAISLGSYTFHGKWMSSLFGFMLPIVVVMPIRIYDYFARIRQLHYLDYRVRRTERITDECVTSSRELRAQMDAGVNVWSSNGPPQA
jgi:purine-cytosine permease-like protein